MTTPRTEPRTICTTCHGNMKVNGETCPTCNGQGDWLYPSTLMHQLDLDFVDQFREEGKIWLSLFIMVAFAYVQYGYHHGYIRFYI